MTVQLYKQNSVLLVPSLLKHLNNKFASMFGRTNQLDFR